MSETPSWVKHLDGRQRPRSHSVQPMSTSFWDSRDQVHQPLKWQPDYNQRLAGPPSPVNSPGQSARSSIPHSGSRSSLLSRLNSGGNLDPIPEDHFLDRGADFRYMSGVRNPVFEMSELSPAPPKKQKRRFSEGDLLERGFEQTPIRNDNFAYRTSNFGSISNSLNVEDSRQDRRKINYNRDMRGDLRSDMRSESKSDISARSVQSGRSGRSGSVASDKSEDTKSSRNDRRRSETGTKSRDRRPSAAPSRRSTDSSKSSVSNNNKSESNVLAASPIEIPIEFLETPSSRIKKLFGPVIMCVLVVTLAASLGAAIYFATVLKEAQQQTIDLLKAQLEFSTSGVNIQTLSLKQRQTLTSNYCKQMDEFYKQSALFQNTYQKCEVDRLSNSKITFTLYFEDDDNQASIEDEIVDVLKAQAKSNSKEVEVNELKLDLETVKVTLEKVKDVVPAVEATARPVLIIDATTATAHKPVTTPSTTAHVPSAIPSQQTTPTSSSSTSPTASSKSSTSTTTAGTTSADKLVKDPCEGQSGVYLPHHRECNLYIQCLNGASVTFVCPLGTVFHISKNVCVIKTDDVVCPEKPPTGGYDWSARDPWDPCRTGKGQQFFPYPEECNLFFQCQHNVSLVQLCPINTVFDTTQKICVPPGPNVICNTLNQLPTPAAIVQVATAKNTGTTTTPLPIVYPARPNYNPKPCQGGVNGGLYPHATNCSKYIICEFAKERIRSCASGLYFDPTYSTCLTPQTDLLCPDIRPCKNLDDGFFPHPKDCRKFIMCKDKKEVIQQCMHKDVWNARTNACVPKTESIQCPEDST